MKKMQTTMLSSVAVILLLAACAHVRYTAPDPVPVELLPSYKQDNAEVPARIEVVNFVVNSVDANFSDDGKNTFRRYHASNIPKKLYELLGGWRSFSEVKRAVSANNETMDYIVSGTYDFSQKRVQAPFYHEISVKGVLRVRIARSKDSFLILDKDYVEERSDSASSYQPIRVLYMQDAFIQAIAVEIKRKIAEDVGALRSGSPGVTPR